MKLTNKQQEILNNLFLFLFSDRTEFYLTGSAGTGKTTIIKEIDNIFQKYKDTCILTDTKQIYDKVLYTATTNEAVNVLKQALNVEAQTVHSTFSLQIKDNYQTGKKGLTAGKSTTHRNKIIIIDESSMIDQNLYSIIIGSIYKCKLIFVGDKNQLLPIKSSFNLLSYSDNKNNLTEIIRSNSNQNLQDLSEILKNNVETKTVISLDQIERYVPIINKKYLIETIIPNEFINTEHSNIFLSYTNKAVETFNQYLRKKRGFTSPILNQGEIIINKNAFTNGIGSSKKEFYNVKTQFNIINYNYLENFSFPLRDPVKDLPYSTNFNFNIAVNVYHVTINSNSTQTTVIQVPVDPTQLILAKKIEATHKNWKTFFYLENHLGEFTFKDALTVHSAQGKTYDTVVIDYPTLMQCKQRETLVRLLYVAFTRASKNVYVLNY
jgi:superfamily I DNA/RNA helicase